MQRAEICAPARGRLPAATLNLGAVVSYRKHVLLRGEGFHAAMLNLAAVSSPTAHTRFALPCGQFSAPFLALRATCSYAYVGVLRNWHTC